MKLLSMKDLQSALDLDCFQVKDRENATLRNELTKLKAQLNHEQRGKEILEARESERKIALEAKERERIRMAEQVEEKRRARKQKQREQAQVPIIRLFWDIPKKIKAKKLKPKKLKQILIQKLNILPARINFFLSERLIV